MFSDFVTQMLTTLADLGYFGVAIGLAIEIIPSEIVLAYAGYLISKGEINYFGAIAAGTFGILIAQLILYWIGAYGGRPFLLKYGKYLLIHERHIDVAEKWFNKYGAGVIFTGRFIPVIRQAISIPAGIAKMSYAKFIFYTLLATIPWSVLFIFLGERLASNWAQIDEAAAPYVKPVGAIAVIVIIAYIAFSMYRKKKRS
ncbi:DedA family protein [Weizmannia acidilactici]|uniref:DedA family protein n=1 Tax=Weizmannia acidilactici TaxID=2607726 RepID=UPI00124C0265|nr:DedA family protein [Weizmannia acidilactici]GER74439.1 membrane protein [Weizmannia acidilactici]